MTTTLKEQLNARRDEKKARATKKRKKATMKAKVARDRKCSTKRVRKHRKAVAAEKPAAKMARLEILHAKSTSKRVRKEWEIAQQELARRELARRRLLPFIQRFDPSYVAAWFHKDLCQQLERFLQRVIDKKEPRLMLFVPPRHGKSITSSQNFPAWAFGKHPELEFISTSYAETLQIDFSKKIQAMIRSDEYRILFPGVTIPKNHESVSRWQLAMTDSRGVPKLTGGGLLAAGVGGPLTGRGANIGLIDDPVKNAEEADSELIRNTLKNWYSSTFYTRMAPGGGILIIQTRWHDDDLSGWLIHEMMEAVKEMEPGAEWPSDVDRWEVISYPAIATEDEKYRKKGEALHPERYSLKALKKKRRTMIPRHWSALYQQNPVADEGSYFSKDMIRYYSPSELPPLEELDIYCAGDLAISKADTADFTVFEIAGLDINNKLWVLDVRRGRWNTDEITDQIIDIHKVHNPIRFGLEEDKIAMAITGEIERKCREHTINRKPAPIHSLFVEPLKIKGRDKRLRARPIQGRMARGEVLVPRGALWVDNWVNEHLRFDAGRWEDCVDANAWIGQMVKDETFRVKNPIRKKKNKSWKDQLKKHVKGTSRGNPMLA